MNRSVLLLLLSLCSLGMCQEEDYSYHFVNINKTWQEAQKYCRKHYTHLVTVSDRADPERICGGNTKCPGNNGAWIGLQHNESLKETWRWTQPGLEYDSSQAKWNTSKNQPNNKHGANEKCVAKTEEWHDYNCKNPRPFICYNESTNSSKAIAVTKTWLGALQYCRENHTDLVGGTQPMPNQSDFHWIGLFRVSWQWSNGSSSSFRNWDEEEEVLNNDWNKVNQCARLENNGKWKSANCTDERPFICYDDQMILIKEKKTWEEALLHCRRNFGELAVMSTCSQSRMVQARADRAETQFVWVGLHYTCFFEEWIWVDGRYASEGKWDKKEPHECGLAGAVKRDGKKKWFGKSSEEKYNFVCSVSCRSKNNMGTCYKK